MATVVTLLLLGAALLFLETLLPGLIAGILGLISIVAGIVMGYTQFGVKTGNLILGLTALALLLSTACWVKYFPGSRLAGRFISQRQIGTLGVEKFELLNQIGTAYSNLRPSGMALINGKRVDVVTEGEMIERGRAIKVVAVEGLRVVVRAV